MTPQILNIFPVNIFRFKNIFIDIINSVADEEGIAVNRNKLILNEKTEFHSMELGRDIPPNSPYSIHKEIVYNDEGIILRCRLEASCWNETETARTFLSFELSINGRKIKFYSGSENTEYIDHLVIQEGDADKIKNFFIETDS
jgi:hypothetical protein